jgi:hypothetical protein
VDKRYQIFVSSTFADLQSERQAVMQALLSLDHFPAGMELFPASDDDQWTLIQGVIDDSDYYILVIGGRYGSISADGIGYTEMEFEYAKEKKKPILAFLHQNPDQIPAGKSELTEAAQGKLASFRKAVESGRHVKYWTSADDLRAKVIQSISAETKRNPQEGWVRSSKASDPVLVESLRQRIDELESEIKTAGFAVPKDSNLYSGGEDVFHAAIRFNLPGSYSMSGLESVKMTWNQIFREVGPIMMEEASEAQMKSRLSSEIWAYATGKGNNPKITDDDFETIKIQLLALGLIQKSTKKHVPSDTNRYWSLTSYGETVLMKLRAIPKSVVGTDTLQSSAQ